MNVNWIIMVCGGGSDGSDVCVCNTGSNCGGGLVVVVDVWYM